MRDRSFLMAGESPRPFSEILAERAALDVDAQLRRRTVTDIAALEAEASEQTDAKERKRLQCEAEALRCALDEQSGRFPCVRL